MLGLGCWPLVKTLLVFMAGTCVVTITSLLGSIWVEKQTGSMFDRYAYGSLHCKVWILKKGLSICKNEKAMDNCRDFGGFRLW